MNERSVNSCTAALLDYLDNLLGEEIADVSITDDKMPEEVSAGTSVASGEMETVTEAALPDNNDTGPTANEHDYYCYDIAGIRLLVQGRALLEEMQAVVTLPPAMGMPAWVVGTWTDAGMACTVVDTCKLLGLPGTVMGDGNNCMLVRLQDHGLALAVPSAGDIEHIDPETVVWRGQDSSRLWMAGTISASRSVLLDVDGLAAMLG